MSKTPFETNPRSLEHLLSNCESGKIQLPDFQRSWVWAEDRILSLIASISRAFPIGALMTLKSDSGTADIFARRPVEGAAAGAENEKPEELLLDGQQRMTSLYQSCLRDAVVETITPKNKLIKRWFYIDIEKSLQEEGDREEAIFTVPEDKRLKTNFDKDIVLDLSKAEFEYRNLMFPLNKVFNWDEWQDGFGDYWIERNQNDRRDLFRQFKNDVLSNFKSYQVPVIALANDTSHEAVCLVFEKVNTGGKALDAFELLTAMYAAQGHKLRDDWLGSDSDTGIQHRLSTYATSSGQKAGVLSKVASTDFLQAVALLYTKTVRDEKAKEGVKEKDLPGVRATRQSLLDLPLEGYKKHHDAVEMGFKQAAKFLYEQHIYRVLDVPYQTQLVPLAAIFAEMKDVAEHATNKAKIAQWYWCGVFGEVYGSAVESRFAKDIVEVPAWLAGGSEPTTVKDGTERKLWRDKRNLGSSEPTTVKDGTFRADRLLTMRSRLSAAYKGVHALLMHEGAKDFRSGQQFNTTVFFDESVDIHHVFPEKWCKEKNIEPVIYNSIVNKTPLTYRTNRIIGGDAPSKYLAKLEAGKKGANGQIETPPIEPSVLDDYLKTHCIPVNYLRADDFEAFMRERQRQLLSLIETVTGHQSSDATDASEGEELDNELARDTEELNYAD